MEKTNVQIIVNLIDYVPHSVACRTLMQKITGNIIAIAIDSGETMEEKISPFDFYVQVIEGETEFLIDNIKTILSKGQAIVVPAHASRLIRAITPSKLIKTLFKSGYEGNII
jgi:quercetin dioxygenase-like cupin family protein